MEGHFKSKKNLIFETIVCFWFVLKIKFFFLKIELNYYDYNNV